jgi:HK97 gp10 family phage protein
LPKEFLDSLSKLEARTDDIAPKILEAGGNVVLQEVRSRLRAALSGKSTGELEAALGMSPAKVDREGNHNIKIGFREPRRGGKSNAMIANVIEFGKHGQPPRPFLKPAKTASRKACVDAMTAVLESELNKL